ncbi:hypothetical protein BZA77DRAFT_343808 [Pyronema omphalodes]|nr:hypothetical protein BZA77DRAFT_343808 [Pyronema omphalodes]
MSFAEALAGRMFNRRVSSRVGVVRGGGVVVAATGRNGGGSGGEIIAGDSQTFGRAQANRRTAKISRREQDGWGGGWLVRRWSTPAQRLDDEGKRNCIFWRISGRKSGKRRASSSQGTTAIIPTQPNSTGGCRGNHAPGAIREQSRRILYILWRLFRRSLGPPRPSCRRRAIHIPLSNQQQQQQRRVGSSRQAKASEVSSAASRTEKQQKQQQQQQHLAFFRQTVTGWSCDIRTIIHATLD